MSTPPQIALIGAGGIGRFHLDCILKLQSEGLARLVAVADPTADRFPALRDELCASGVVWHSDYREMLENTVDLNAVVIATPIPLHREMAHACLAKGVFVLMEKPPVPLIQELDDLIQADANDRVSVGFQIIVSQFVQRLKAAVVAGSFGEISDIRCRACWPRTDDYYKRAAWAGKMQLGGEPVFDGPATNALSHMIHNIMFLAASEAEAFDEPAEATGELYRARPIESYDVACLRGRFPSGIRFAAALAHATAETLPYSIEVRGSKGWARISGDGALLEGNVVENGEGRQETPELLLEMHREFIDWIAGRRARTSTRLRDTRGYVLATNGMLASSGGIHVIGDEWMRHQGVGDNRLVAVTGLPDIVENVFQTGRLFSEQGVPWAKPSSLISLVNLRRLDFFQYCERTPEETERSGIDSSKADPQ